jgi:hypothetical protein
MYTYLCSEIIEFPEPAVRNIGRAVNLVKIAEIFAGWDVDFPITQESTPGFMALVTVEGRQELHISGKGAVQGKSDRFLTDLP